MGKPLVEMKQILVDWLIYPGLLRRFGAACPGNGGQEDVSTRPAGPSARYRR
jgi:hypothetical protein